MLSSVVVRFSPGFIAKVFRILFILSFSYLILLYNLFIEKSRLLCTADNILDNKVDDSESEYADDQADETVENGVFGFLDFASITRGGHVIDATDNHDDDAD